MIRTAPHPATHPVTRPRRARRVALALVAGFVAVLAVTVAGAGPAAAHAVVTSSDPADKAILAAPPGSVTIQFSEPISSDLGGLRVLDTNGNRVDLDDSTQPTESSLRATLGRDLPDGTYVANYKVVSADGHPVNGAIVFGVGDVALGDVSGISEATDPVGEAVSWIGRLLTYLGALTAVGMAFFLGFIHDRARDWKTLATGIRVTSAVAVVGVILLVIGQAALATGRGPGSVTEANVLGNVLREGLGWQVALLLVGLALCQAGLLAGSRILAQSLLFYGALAAAASFAFYGHSNDPDHRWFLIPLDIVHVGFAGLWVGSLVSLAVLLTVRGRTDVTPPAAPTAGSTAASDDEAGGRDRAATATVTRSLPVTDTRVRPGSLGSTVGMIERFGTLAAVSVIVLALAGVGLSVVELGSFDALFDTDYGRILAIKLAVVAVVLFLAGFNRFRLVPWLLGQVGPVDDDDAGDDEATGGGVPDTGANRADALDALDGMDELEEAELWRPLRRTMLLEVLGLAVVLGLTGVLVNATPASELRVPTPLQERAPFAGGEILVVITPNAAGAENDIHVETFGPDGRPADLVQSMDLELSLPEQDIGPIKVELIKAGIGHFFREQLTELSLAGEWEVTIVARVEDFDQEKVTFTDEVR